jgi:hypothetical protein
MITLAEDLQDLPYRRGRMWVNVNATCCSSLWAWPYHETEEGSPHGWVRPKNMGESAQGNVRGTNVMRILVAFEDDYRAYADALAKAISAARPHLDVATVGLEALHVEVALLDPHLIICSSPNPIPPKQQEEGTLLAWVELSVDLHRPSKFCLRKQRWESLNPSLEDLVAVVEETERLLLGSSRRSGAR